MASARPGTESEIIIEHYLEDNNQLVVRHRTVTVQFRDGAHQLPIANVLQTIASHNGLQLVNIAAIHEQKLGEIRLNKEEFPPKLVEQISLLEERHHVTIEVASFRASKAVVSLGNILFINKNFQSFLALIDHIDEFEPVKVCTYLSGLLGLPIDFEKSIK